MNSRILILTFAGLISWNCSAAPSFKNNVMPIFMRGGCNAGDCHGAARGKDGFMLSLFGYDPDGDYYRLIEEYPGRRINTAAPEKSLILEKASGSVTHTGGEIFKKGSEHYETLRQWIAAGAPLGDTEEIEPVRLELSPAKTVFNQPGQSRQADIIAHYSDGSKRDVSNLALYLSNNESIATIDDQAKIAGQQVGATHVFARFDKFTVGAEVVVFPPGQFQWSNPKEHNYIDQLAFTKLKELRIQSSALCTDEQFLRRATIDLTGLLPTVDEYQSFISDQDPSKRAQLIERLMKRDEFAELWAAKWGEWLRLKSDTNPGSGTAMKAGWNYYQWLRERMLDNTPWDQLARDLLAGNGSNFRNPPSNYYTMLPQGKLEPKKLSEDTAQIFMGLRTQCAQCHNHPFDRWTIDDYYSFTSFFTGVRRKHGSEAREYYTYVDTTAEPAKHLVDERPMPHRFLGGDLADIENKDPRKVLATWLTQPGNQLFRRNLANRIWDQFFGRGIVHPVDDIRISNPPSNEPLLEELGRRLGEDYDYDMRRLVRDICMSRTYQLSPTTNESNRGDKSRFSHAYLRRLRADVHFDCISQALDYQHRFRRSTATRAVVMFEGGQRDDYNRYFFSTFGQAQRESVCTCETKSDANLSQALHLMNGKTIQDALTRNPTLIPRLMKELKDPEKIIDHLYLRILTRHPSASEKSKILANQPNTTDQRQLKTFYDSVAWALLNSNEFMFNH